MIANDSLPAILDWLGVLKTDVATVGGKARQLARLWEMGLPVPEGLVITVSTFAQDGVRSEANDRGGSPDGAMVEDASPELLHALRHELASRGWLDRSLAVRSSAVGEDSTKASFAGIYRSCLNVRGFDQVRSAIREVRASLHSPAAAAYRNKLNTDQAGAIPAMAVIVMPLLPAVASGIAFTCDPASGRDDRMIIHAQWGLGESLVSGQAVGDEYVFGESALDDHWCCSRKARAASWSRPLPGPTVEPKRLPLLRWKPAALSFHPARPWNWLSWCAMQRWQWISASPSTMWNGCGTGKGSG
jgi:pyruvate,water dikinase